MSDVREPWDVERADALSVTARIPLIDEFASFDPNASGPQDPNPEDEPPPEAPEPPAPAVRINHVGGALVAAAVAIGLAVASHLGSTPLLAGVAGLQGLLVLSWVFGTVLPGRMSARWPRAAPTSWCRGGRTGSSARCSACWGSPSR